MRRFVPAHEGMALHVRGRLDAGQTEQRRREIDERNQAAGRTAGFVLLGRQATPLFREMGDQRDVEAGIVGPALRPRHTGAVVAIEEDDRIVGQTVGGEL